MHAHISKKYVAEQGIAMPNWSETFETFWWHSYPFALEKQRKNLNFQTFYTSNKPFGGYFQWKACTYFQKIYNSTRYTDAKLIKNISNFFVKLVRFYFRKTTWVFLPFKNHLVASFNEAHAPTSRNNVVEQGLRTLNWSKTF